MPTATAPRLCACGAPITRKDAAQCRPCANRRHAFTSDAARAATATRTRRYRRLLELVAASDAPEADAARARLERLPPLPVSAGG